MENTKLDRRVRKTRALLQQGLTQLMKEKNVSDISVKELADLVDINRGTFYLHYKDIFDMVDKIEDELFQEFNQILDKNFTETNPNPTNMLNDVFIFLSDNRDIVNAMIGPHGDLSFVNRLKTLFRKRLQYLWKKSEHTMKNFEYYYAFEVSGCIGVIETWLQSDSKETPQEMAALTGDMILSGIDINI